MNRHVTAIVVAAVLCAATAGSHAATSALVRPGIAPGLPLPGIVTPRPAGLPTMGPGVPLVQPRPVTNALTTLDQVRPPTDSSNEPCADFTGDGNADVVWQDPITGEIVVQEFDRFRGLISSRRVPPIVPFFGSLMAVGCMDQLDRWPDLVLQDKSTNDVHVLRMNGTMPLEDIPVTNSESSVVGAADFNGDGSTDLVFQHPVYLDSFIEFMNGTSILDDEPLTTIQNSSFRILSAGDFDRDGHPDLLLQDTNTGQVVCWLMSGPTTLGTVVPVIATTSLRLIGGGELSGDTFRDLLLQDPNSGDLWVWYMQGTQIATARRLTSATRWRAMSRALDMPFNGRSPSAYPQSVGLDTGPNRSYLTRTMMRIQSKRSGKCLEVMNGLWLDGGLLQQRTCDTSRQQAFWMTSNGTIRTFAGRVLEPGGMASGALIFQFSNIGAAQQKWRLDTLGPSEIAVVNMATGLVLEIADTSDPLADGALARQARFSGGANQLWSVMETGIDLPRCSVVATDCAGWLVPKEVGMYRLIAAHSGKCLDVPGGTLTAGVQLQQWDCNGSMQQVFWLTETEKGMRKVMAVSGRVLDVLALSRHDGAAVGQWDFVNENNQKWMLLPLPNNEFALMSLLNGKVLDISGGPAATQNGAPLQMWSFLGGANQRFRLEKVVP
jgi:hypothetical protein